MIAENAEESQVIRSKCKEITSGDEKGHQPPKKAKEKYHKVAIVKIGVLTSVRDVCVLGRIAWYTTQGE